MALTYVNWLAFLEVKSVIGQSYNNSSVLDGGRTNFRMGADLQ
jgi:hypothetical protein